MTTPKPLPADQVAHQEAERLGQMPTHPIGWAILRLEGKAAAIQAEIDRLRRLLDSPRKTS